MWELELDGSRYRLEPAAISAIRYRAACGESILETLARGLPPKELEGKLLRMCHLMIPAAERPELRTLARQARRDGRFLPKGMRARSALLEPDGGLEPPEEESSGEPFDEYRLLAAMTLAGVELGLLYELPILHVVGVLRRLGQLRDTERRHYRPLTGREMAQLYPRPTKKAAPKGALG